MEQITIKTMVKVPVERVWELWTSPNHILHWNNASPDWHTTYAENDPVTGGKFNYRMEAKDGSFGFDFWGIYDEVKLQEQITYTMGDGRKAAVIFQSAAGNTTIIETFEAETENAVDMQRTGWQAILDNFKKYAESSADIVPLHFEININAPAEKVYAKMLDKKTYEEWTHEFNPTSYYKGSWNKGEKILFIGTDKNGVAGGMVSKIKENIPNKFVSIEHIGILKDNQEITSGEAIKGWAGALENYTFRSTNGHTTLSIDIDANEEFKSYFNDTWPKALNKLKIICENN